MARILVFTGSRAEYGLLYPVLARLRGNPAFDLRLLATGTHLSPAHGFSRREIEADGFAIDEAVEMLLATDTETGVAKSMGLGLALYAEAFARQRPDAVLLLGDRYEVLAAAAAAAVLRIPLIHLEGGHLTFGAIDDAMRHAVTKLSHLHFTATENYRRRIVQMGEDPARVHAVGSTGLDNVLAEPRIGRAELERHLGFGFGETLLVATFHPATLERGLAPEAQVAALLAALDRFAHAQVLFTLPNADAGGLAIAAAIEAYAAARPGRVRAVASLGRRLYASVLAQAAGVVGNSSSGLIEAPSFGIGTVNIGSRQDGRMRAGSVVDCAAESDAIAGAIERILQPDFRAAARQIINPFGDGRAAERIVAVLAGTDFGGLIEKRFQDR